MSWHPLYVGDAVSWSVGDRVYLGLLIAIVDTPAHLRRYQVRSWKTESWLPPGKAPDLVALRPNADAGTRPYLGSLIEVEGRPSERFRVTGLRMTADDRIYCQFRDSRGKSHVTPSASVRVSLGSRLAVQRSLQERPPCRKTLVRREALRRNA